MLNLEPAIQDVNAIQDSGKISSSAISRLKFLRSWFMIKAILYIATVLSMIAPNNHVDAVAYYYSDLTQEECSPNRYDKKVLLGGAILASAAVAAATGFAAGRNRNRCCNSCKDNRRGCGCNDNFGGNRFCDEGFNQNRRCGVGRNQDRFCDEGCNQNRGRGCDLGDCGCGGDCDCGGDFGDCGCNDNIRGNCCGEVVCKETLTFSITAVPKDSLPPDTVLYTYVLAPDGDGELTKVPGNTVTAATSSFPAGAPITLGSISVAKTRRAVRNGIYTIVVCINTPNGVGFAGTNVAISVETSSSQNGGVLALSHQEQPVSPGITTEIQLIYTNP